MLTIERRGGIAGFGGPHLKSRGQCDPKGLSSADRETMEQLFASGGRPPAGQPPAGGAPDMFTYRITRQKDGRQEAVDVPEPLVPEAVRTCVKDTLE